ncbi:hypothetical protein ADICYQ_4232 [Cyclobacterium qasimii M12-11B]|uniref:Uncharacterized protein n=1 Tax=Cyclobacterium qasimii M12-11B TaxID=641524 RepID=S7V992_9BACT|nr:hypothetical protein ADICYQ_4232 [Cyclobacterium qasimii M12-11B]
MDSVVVDVLEPLVIDDQQLSGEAFLMRGTKSRNPYLVSKNGKVIKAYDLLNESPNGIGFNGAFGYNFLGEEKWVGLSHAFYKQYHIYNLEGEKSKVLDTIDLGVFKLTFSFYQSFFWGFIKDGEEVLFGIEDNLFDPNSLSKENRDQPMYYDSVKTIFTYRVKDQFLKQFNAYPESWGPRKERKYVGNSAPFIAYHRSKHLMAVLPKVSNQLFIYDFSGNEPVLLHEVTLTHKYRPQIIPEIAEEAEYTSSYPRFTALSFVGDRIIAEFKTRIPEDILERLMVQSSRVDDLPEYQEAKKNFVKTFYLVIEDGKQIGVVEELPVHGVLDFANERGEIFINDNLGPLVEREYNVFYRLKLEK